MALHQSQEPLPRLARQGHLEAGQIQGCGELAPIVIGPAQVIALGLLAGLAVCDELLWGGPKVLGRNRHVG